MCIKKMNIVITSLVCFNTLAYVFYAWHVSINKIASFNSCTVSKLSVSPLYIRLSSSGVAIAWLFTQFITPFPVSLLTMIDKDFLSDARQVPLLPRFRGGLYHSEKGMFPDISCYVKLHRKSLSQEISQETS